MSFKDKIQGKQTEDETAAETAKTEYEVIFEPNKPDDADNANENQEQDDNTPDDTAQEKEDSRAHFEMLQRLAAEFDNYKKRTVKEKEGLYDDAVKDVVLAILPVLDNLERAVQSDIVDAERFREGVVMVLKQFNDALKDIGVEEIKAEGEKFDPEIHSAVMHVIDAELGTNVIVEELQRGYRIKDKIIRYSVVKVAN